jgi:hypothetical protein
VRRLFDLQIESTDVYWSIFGLARTAALRETKLIESYLASDRTLLFHLLMLGDLVEAPGMLFHRREHDRESMVENSTNPERAKWFDTSQKPKARYFPFWRLLREHVGVARRHGLGWGATARCYFQILRRFAHDWRGMGGEIKAALRPSTYRRRRFSAPVSAERPRRMTGR